MKRVVLKFILGLFVSIVTFVLYQLFIINPFTWSRISSDSPFIKHEPGVVYQKLPYILKSHIIEVQKTMFHTLVNMLNKANIPFWLTKTTLLNIVRFQQLAPWQDEISLSIMIDSKPRLVDLRPELEKTQQFLLYYNQENGSYQFKHNSFSQFPVIDIDLMDIREDSVEIGTPIDELGRCTFEDSKVRSNEIFSQDVIFPLKSIGLLPDRNVQVSDRNVQVGVPNNRVQYLQSFFGVNWKTSLPDFHDDFMSIHLDNRASKPTYDRIRSRAKFLHYNEIAHFFSSFF